MAKVYKVKENEMQFNARGFEYRAGMTYATPDTVPETLGTFADIQKAMDFLLLNGSHVCIQGGWNGPVAIVSETYIESVEVDEDGDEVDGWELVAVAASDFISDKDFDELVRDASAYGSEEDFVKSYGWMDWMDAFTNSNDGDEASEGEIRNINNVLREAWKKAQEEKEDE